MKKLLLIAALTLAGSTAWSQSNQSQTGTQIDSPGHPTANAPDPARPEALREGTTTGMGRTGTPNSSPAEPPKSTTGPMGEPSKSETPPR
jgi:hypothetical protein